MRLSKDTLQVCSIFIAVHCVASSQPCDFVLILLSGLQLSFYNLFLNVDSFVVLFWAAIVLQSTLHFALIAVDCAERYCG